MSDRILADVRAATPKKNGPWPAPKLIRENDGLSTKPAPGPRGPSGTEAIAWVRERKRREREAGET